MRLTQALIKVEDNKRLNIIIDFMLVVKMSCDSLQSIIGHFLFDILVDYKCKTKYYFVL